MTKVHRKLKVTALDEGWSWVTLSAGFVIYMLTAGSVKSFGVLYDELLVQFGAGAGNTAWVAALSMFLLLAPGPMANYLSTAYSYRVVVAAGGVSVALGYASSAFVPQMEIMYLTYGLIVGLGYGLIFTPTVTIVSLYFDKRRALANGLLVAGSGIGAFSLPYLYGALIDEYGIRGTLLIQGGIMLHICVASGFFRQPVLQSHVDDITHEEMQCLRENNEENGEDEDPQENEGIQSDSRTRVCCGAKIMSDSDQRTKPKFDWLLFKNPIFVVYWLSFLFGNSGYSSGFIIIFSHCNTIGLSKDHSTIVLSVYGVGEIVGRLFLGWFGDFRLFRRKFIYIASMTIAGTSCMMAPLATSLPGMLAFSVVYGLFAGSFWAIIAVMLTDSFGLDKFTSAFGLTALAMAIGTLLGPPVIGWLRDATGSWSLSFRVTGSLMLVSAGILLFEPLLMKIRFRVKKPEDIIVHNVCDTERGCNSERSKFLAGEKRN